MPNIEMFNESRWTVDDFAQIAESMTNDPDNPVVFQFSLTPRANPMTRKQLAALGAMIAEVLEKRPERLIVGVEQKRDIKIPELVPPGRQR